MMSSSLPFFTFALLVAGSAATQAKLYADGPDSHLVRRESHQKAPAPMEALAAAPNSMLEKAKAGDSSSSQSTTMLSVVFTATEATQNKLVVTTAGAPSFSDATASETTSDSTSRWNVLDSREHPGSVYIQSASRTNNEYLHDSGSGVTISSVPHSWDLEATGSGLLKLKSAVTGKYIVDNEGELLSSARGSGKGRDFKVELLSVAWGRSPSDHPSKAVMKVYLTGVSGKNLMSDTGTLGGMNSAFDANELWSVSDAGDSRSLLKGQGGRFLHDDSGTLKVSMMNENAPEPNMEWFLAQVGPFDQAIYLESNDGKYLVDDSGEAKISTAGVTFANTGAGKRFQVTLQEVNFHTELLAT